MPSPAYAMPTVGTVVSLHRYPVKSMTGEEIESSFLDQRGLLGDRSWALVDRETGKVATAKNPKRWPGMLALRAAYRRSPEAGLPLPPIRVTLPDGTVIHPESPEFDSRVSALLGRPVDLVAADGRPGQPAVIEEYWPDLEDLRHRDVVTDETLPAGSFFDAAPVHLLSTATLQELARLAPDQVFDVRRFRPNIVIRPLDATAGFVEHGWVGQSLQVGPEAVLSVIGHCGRCVMTTLAQGELPKDSQILRTIAAHNRVRLGVYAEVTAPGTIRPGDRVVLRPFP